MTDAEIEKVKESLDQFIRLRIEDDGSTTEYINKDMFAKFHLVEIRKAELRAVISAFSYGLRMTGVEMKMKIKELQSQISELEKEGHL